MKLFFVDDSRNSRPTRNGMGPLVGVGGIWIDHTKVRSLETAIDNLCREVGFPADKERGEFKWSPKRDKHWMYENLIGEPRTTFFRNVLALAHEHEVKAMLVVEDSDCNYANMDSCSHEADVVLMFLERVQNRLVECECDGIVIVDRYSGNREAEDRFVESCMTIVQNGTRFVAFGNIAVGVMCCPSKFVRLIQLADLVTGSTMAWIGGEDAYSPPVVERVKPMLYVCGSTMGGYGVKIHPDYIYANLYHWLFGDQWFRNARLPIAGRAYSTGA